MATKHMDKRKNSVLFILLIWHVIRAAWLLELYNGLALLFAGPSDIPLAICAVLSPHFCIIDDVIWPSHWKMNVRLVVGQKQKDNTLSDPNCYVHCTMFFILTYEHTRTIRERVKIHKQSYSYVNACTIDKETKKRKKESIFGWVIIRSFILWEMMIRLHICHKRNYFILVSTHTHTHTYMFIIFLPIHNPFLQLSIAERFLHHRRSSPCNCFVLTCVKWNLAALLKHAIYSTVSPEDRLCEALEWQLE